MVRRGYLLLWLRRMLSSGMLRRVALVRTDVSKEPTASIIRVTISEIGTMLAVTSSVRRMLVTANVSSSPILITLMREALCSSETSVITRATLTSQETAFFIVTAVKTSNLT
jgi:hypothetical protein